MRIGGPSPCRGRRGLAPAARRQYGATTAAARAAREEAQDGRPRRRCEVMSIDRKIEREDDAEALDDDPVRLHEQNAVSNLYPLI